MTGHSRTRLPVLFGLSVTSVVGFVFGEAWIIAIVTLLGPLLGFLTLSALCVIITMGIVFAYDRGEWSRWGPVRRLGQWLRQREGNMGRTILKLSRGSWLVALLLSTVTAGPFLTVILAKVVGRPKTNSYMLGFCFSLIFSATWTAIYSGAFAAAGLL